MYIIYTINIAVNVIGKLKNDDIDIITIDMIDDEIITKCKTFKSKCFELWKKSHWSSISFNRKRRYRRDNMFDGFWMWHSFVCDLIERKIRKDSKIPFIVLNIDEHSERQE